MIVSSQVDLVCWTERVCRDCREALTTVTLEEPAGSRNVQRSRGATGCRLFRDLRQLSGEPMPDPSMTAAAASHWQRYDFRCGSKTGSVRARAARPFFLQKQTPSGRTGMSVRCQERKSSPFPRAQSKLGGRVEAIM
jgi:hypothetical protein